MVTVIFLTTPKKPFFWATTVGLLPPIARMEPVCKVRDYIPHKCARVVHIDTTQNCADMFTKPLASVQFRQFRDLFMRLPARFRTPR